MKLYCGARQLQALVRLRTTSHSSGPSLTGSTEGHSPSACPRAAIVTPRWTDAPSSPSHRAPHANGTFILDSAFRFEPNPPDGCRLWMRS